MYLDYWQLAAKPFEPLETRDAFYFPGESPEGALSKLRYAVEQGHAAAALAGPAGVGKTLLVNRLRAELAPAGSDRRFVHAVFPDMSSRDLVAYLAERLGAPAAADGHAGSVESQVRRLEDFASAAPADAPTPIVVIDEAHVLEDTGAFDTLRLLTNLTAGGRPAFTLLLVGQMGLLSAVARRPALDERLAVKTLVRAFTAEETAAYVRGRLAAAGATRDLFSAEALDRLHLLAEGRARRINRLADLALVVGFSDQSPEVSGTQVGAVHDELVTVGAS